jgi:hypothetical protein
MSISVADLVRNQARLTRVLKATLDLLIGHVDSAQLDDSAKAFGISGGNIVDRRGNDLGDC